MNYQRIYDELIFNRKNNPLPKETYTEKHHIIPKSHGGSNEADNLVSLSAREHFVAHWLLWRIYRDKSMANAFFSMRMGRYKKRYHNSYGFEEARKAKSIIMGISQNGKDNHMYGRIGDKHHLFGKKLSDEARAKLSISSKNKSIETRKKISDSLKGKFASNETKAKLSEMRKGEGNSRFDKSIYNFINKDGIQEFCTRYFLCCKYNVDRSKITLIVQGKRVSAFGWIVSKEAMPLSYKPTP